MLQAVGQSYIIKPVWEKETGRYIRFWVPKRGEWSQYDGFVYGLILSTGPKCVFTYQGKLLQPGYKIIFQRHEGKMIKFEGEIYYKMRERWVQAVIEEA